MLNLLTMRQGQQESDDYFNKHFNTNPHTLDLEAGRHIQYRKDIKDKSGDYCTQEEEKMEE